MPEGDSTTLSRYARQYRELKADPIRYEAYLERKRKERLARQVDKQYETERKRKWSAANPIKNQMHHDAHHAVEAAVRTGKLARPDTCESCGATGKIEAHHHLGYEPEHWLDVQWLCQLCHARQHRTVLAIRKRQPKEIESWRK